MPKNNKIKYDELHSSSLFAGVSPRVLKKVALLPFIREHAPNYTIIKKDDVGDFLIIILSGEIDVIDDSEEQEELLETLVAGDFAGEGSLVSGSPRSATLRARTSVRLAYFDRDAYSKMITTDPSITATLIRVHRQRCKETVKKYNVAKSKGFIVMAAFGLLAMLQGSTSFIPHLNDIIMHMPPAMLAIAGPGAVALAFRFQKADMNCLANKMDKL